MQQVAGNLIRSQCLAWSSRMPNIARSALSWGFKNCLNRMYLVRTKQDDALVFAVQHHVVSDHMVSSGNWQNLFCEAQIVIYPLIVLINPGSQKLSIQVLPSGYISCLLTISYYKHFNEAVNVSKLPFIDILLNLIKGLLVRHPWCFELNVYYRQTIDQETHVKSAVLIKRGLFLKLNLVNNLIYRVPSSDISIV